MNSPMNQTDLSGALSLLRDCVGGRPGERLLIVSEPRSNGFYDDQASRLAADVGRSLGMKVYEMESHSFLNNEDEKAILLDSLRGFDHIIFFSRVGDQIRFTKDESLPSSTMCYTLNHESLNSEFGTACHHGMSEVKSVIDNAFRAASEIKVTCKRGTDYIGRPDWGHSGPNEVSLKRFPLLVPQPIPALGFEGKIALSRFLIGTGSRFYEPYYQPLSSDVLACIKDNQIVSFEGDAATVAVVENHYRHVAKQLSIEPWFVDSWHAGIHPGCNFSMEAEADIMRWSGTAFGNPRILHFHTCGEYAPGEISWNVLDPTIVLDGVTLWDNGQLFPERLPEGVAVFDRHPNLADLFANPVREIGLAV